MARTQFVVPQFLDVEAKIIGPITARQFLVMLGTLLLVFVIYRLFLNVFIVLLLGVPVLAMGVIFSFAKVNGQPFHYIVVSLIQTLRRPAKRVWDKTLNDNDLRNLMKKPPVDKLPDKIVKQPLERSRLSELSLIVNTGGVYEGDDATLGMPDQKNNFAKPKAGPPTQRYLDIAEIRENVVIMKDGTLRSVMLVSSINFALKSDDEQQAVVQGYMQFLNGLEHPLQVVIQSRRMNIDGYLARLNQQEETISNELLKTQIRDYMSFVKELVELGEIMQKQFFVVVPYDPADGGEKVKSFISRLQTSLSPAKLVKLNAKQFADRKARLEQRVGNVAAGLQSMGLQAAVLDTQGLIELYYTCYNPEVLDTEKLVDTNKLQVEAEF